MERLKRVTGVVGLVLVILGVVAWVSGWIAVVFYLLSDVPIDSTSPGSVSHDPGTWVQWLFIPGFLSVVLGCALLGKRALALTIIVVGAWKTITSFIDLVSGAVEHEFRGGVAGSLAVGVVLLIVGLLLRRFWVPRNPTEPSVGIPSVVDPGARPE